MRKSKTLYKWKNNLPAQICCLQHYIPSYDIGIAPIIITTVRREERDVCLLLLFAHNQESLGMAPLCWFGSPYRFRQAMSFSWLKPNARQNQLSRSPLRCFQ